MKCFCGKPALESGLCPYHDPNCVKDKSCRRRLAFLPDCEKCNLPGGEVVDVPPRLRGARIYGPLTVQFVTGNVDLAEARGVDVYIHSIRGNVDLRGAKFRHVFVNEVVGTVLLTGARLETAMLQSVKGNVNGDGIMTGGHIYAGDVSGIVSLTDARIVGEAIIEEVKGEVRLRAEAYSISLYRVRGDMALTNSRVEGDIRIVESAGNRLDLSGVEIQGRVVILNSKFGGVRIDKADLIKKLVVL
ncbi:DUF4097 family beta strand repeat-containing protein [Pyrobaculum aerophilum]|uniref:DUF4097 domain-containing protein n=1 Tax=Pyrobaculum aerophilum TaxID=13773 RepID=A0A371R245_9CREN|nr:DUF4097 family beta strand repeat-containing protein [Pyrobaculum aerophilum]RFA97615.1 hypothetical protein CGL52_08785 [Pyrobaculum aerophilum]RFA98053.1 hypothetical protein CGL51_01530 [Pyrobaculum aerophilum]